MEARMYSWGDSFLISMWVSKMMNPQNNKAPPMEMTSSRGSLHTKIYIRTNNIQGGSNMYVQYSSQAYSLYCIMHTVLYVHR